jgi:hypothetical protein
MRIWVPILALGMLAIAGLSAPAQAQSASVTYHLYHFESGNWVEYGPNATLPAGGDQPGTNLWRYVYELCNIGFSTGLRELNMFFNSDNVLCATFAASTQPASWSSPIVGPIAPDNNWRIRYRTLVTAARVAQGTCNDQFTVDFTWICPTLPGAQNFDAIAGSGSYSGQSISGSPVPVEPSTWGRMKGLYR